ncbi:hypothetical protein TWF281_007850 [Arthrobotrys megalospora]
MIKNYEEDRDSPEARSQPTVPIIPYSASNWFHNFTYPIRLAPISEETYLSGLLDGSALTTSLRFAAQSKVSLKRFRFDGPTRYEDTHHGFACPRCMLVDITRHFPNIIEVHIMPKDKTIADCRKSIMEVESATELRVLQVRAAAVMDGGELPPFILELNLNFLLLHFHVNDDMALDQLPGFHEFATQKKLLFQRRALGGGTGFSIYSWYPGNVLGINNETVNVPFYWPYGRSNSDDDTESGLA